MGFESQYVLCTICCVPGESHQTPPSLILPVCEMGAIIMWWGLNEINHTFSEQSPAHSKFSTSVSYD